MFIKVAMLADLPDVLIAGLLLVPVVSLVAAKPDQTLVDNAFSCYEEKVLVPRSRALGDHK